MKNKVLIIKIGALGDVLRTTPILRVLKADVTWVTGKDALPLLKGNPYITNLLSVHEFGWNGLNDPKPNKRAQIVLETHYDLVLSLEEDYFAAKLASLAIKKNCVGAYLSQGKVLYTPSAKGWFDMSLISCYGKRAADKIKQKNKKSYQEILFGMLNLKFNGEEYVLPAMQTKTSKPRPKKSLVVGLEMRSGSRWAAKRWPHFSKFCSLLRRDKVTFFPFRQMPSLNGYVRLIGKADIVVTTDSLALHIALALQKKIVALFTCTSPDELYGYDRMKKIVSPLLNKYYYTTKKTQSPGKAIKVEMVLDAFNRWKLNDK